MGASVTEINLNSGKSGGEDHRRRFSDSLPVCQPGTGVFDGCNRRAELHQQEQKKPII